ncbi:MAG: glycosyl transferase, partial [Desulfobacterales bacterium]|nr:glycosyl transferase [Desulfobacterales bacterium]
RAGRLARLGGLRILEDEDLAPARLASLMTRTLSKKEPPGAGVDLNGAATTASWLASWMKEFEGAS